MTIHSISSFSGNFGSLERVPPREHRSDSTLGCASRVAYAALLILTGMRLGEAKIVVHQAKLPIDPTRHFSDKDGKFRGPGFEAGFEVLTGRGYTGNLCYASEAAVLAGNGYTGDLSYTSAAAVKAWVAKETGPRALLAQYYQGRWLACAEDPTELSAISGSDPESPAENVGASNAYRHALSRLFEPHRGSSAEDVGVSNARRDTLRRVWEPYQAASCSRQPSSDQASSTERPVRTAERRPGDTLKRMIWEDAASGPRSCSDSHPLHSTPGSTFQNERLKGLSLMYSTGALKVVYPNLGQSFEMLLVGHLTREGAGSVHYEIGGCYYFEAGTLLCPDQATFNHLFFF